jgi:hypothetical protein
MVQRHVPLRTGPQIRSHAQKFFKRIEINWINNEPPIQCLKRTNYALDVILSGSDENEDKVGLAKKLNFPPCKCKEMTPIKSPKICNNTLKSSFSNSHKKTKQNVELKSELTENKIHKFSYFPQSYKMSTVDVEILKEVEDPPVAHLPNYSQAPCIHLQAEDTQNHNKRKHSEMVRLEKLETENHVTFDVPTSKEYMETNIKKRINKLMSKNRKRGRIMTESVSQVKNRLGFLPTKNSELTLSSILRLRDKQLPKPLIREWLNMPLYKLSTDEWANSSSVVSNNGKRANVKLLKIDKDMSDHNQGFNRLRFQTF